jgi:hypothetical protein
VTADRLGLSHTTDSELPLGGWPRYEAQWEECAFERQYPTRRSGKSCSVTRRLACNPRLRNAIHYLADAARRCDEKCKAKYLALKARGCSDARALRTIGDRLLYVACSMLKNRPLFDPAFESQKAA